MGGEGTAKGESYMVRSDVAVHSVAADGDDARCAGGWRHLRRAHSAAGSGLVGGTTFGSGCSCQLVPCRLLRTSLLSSSPFAASLNGNSTELTPGVELKKSSH